MKSKLTVAAASIAGAFLIYCSQNAMRGGVPVGNVNAQNPTSCCGPNFTTLSEGTLDMTHLSVGPLDVGTARTVVLYTDFNASNCRVGLTFVPTRDGSPTKLVSSSITAGEIHPVIGPQLALSFSPGGNANCTSIPYLLLGIN